MAWNCDGLRLDFLVFTQVFHYIRSNFPSFPPHSGSIICSKVFISPHQNPFLPTHSLFRLLSALAAPLKQTSSSRTNHAGLEIVRAALQGVHLFWDVCVRLCVLVCVTVWVSVCDCVSVSVCDCVSVSVCDCMC